MQKMALCKLKRDTLHAQFYEKMGVHVPPVPLSPVEKRKILGCFQLVEALGQACNLHCMFHCSALCILEELRFFKALQSLELGWRQA